jgi:glucosamine 6-phosphate synthetase-like amidotransferase/phosphosugar isomerase protein
MQTAESKVEAQPREGSDSEDDELKSEQLKQMDYGYREKAIVLPEDDCFTKL